MRPSKQKHHPSSVNDTSLQEQGLPVLTSSHRVNWPGGKPFNPFAPKAKVYVLVNSKRLAYKAVLARKGLLADDDPKTKPESKL